MKSQCSVGIFIWLPRVCIRTLPPPFSKFFKTEVSHTHTHTHRKTLVKSCICPRGVSVERGGGGGKEGAFSDWLFHRPPPSLIGQKKRFECFLPVRRQQLLQKHLTNFYERWIRTDVDAIVC